MKTAVVAAIAAACLLASVPVVADEAPACQDLAASRVKAQEIANQTGAGLVSLDGDQAKRFLVVVNTTGVPTDFKADHLSILMFVRGGFALVAIDDSPCHGYETGIKIGLDVALKAYRAAIGQGV